MNWSERIFAYCERAGSPAFWAEPFNALSNGAFLIAAVVAALMLASRDDRGARWFEWTLVGLTAVIGTGSFLFHTLATRWAAVADTAPIGLFMLGYFAYAVRRLMGAGWPVTAVLTAGFVAALRFAEQIPCDPGLLPITQAAGRPCFNGSLGYLPALAALVGIGTLLAIRRVPAAAGILTASAVFAGSLAFRTLDMEVCAMTELLGKARGTHALWHLANATVLFLLLRTAIRHGAGGAPARISS